MSSKLIKVEGEPELRRDSASGGIVTDDAAYARYKASKRKKLREASQEARINSLEQKVEELSSGMNEILSILRSKNGNSPS